MLLLAAVTLFAAGCTPPGPRALLTGKRLIEEQKYPEAVQELRTATQLMGTNAMAWLYLGLACHHAGETAEAEKAYQKSLALDRDLTEVHYNLGCLWLEQNKIESAKAEFLAYTLRRNDSPEAFLKLGGIHLRMRETTAAERAFQETLKLDTNNVAAITGLGLVRVQRNRPTEAPQYFAQALRLQPDYRPALLNMAIVSHQNYQDRATAVQYYRRYLAGPVPAEDSNRVAEVVAQLEREMAAASGRTAPVAPTTLAAQAPPTKPAASNITRVATAPKPEPTLPPAGAKPPTNAPRVMTLAQAKPEATTQTAPKATPPPTPSSASPASKPPPQPEPPSSAGTSKPEVVQVPSETVIRPGGAVTIPPKPAASTSPTTPQVKTSTPPAPAQVEKKKPFIQRVNPLNLFSHEQQATNPAAVPATGTAVAGKAPAKSPASTPRIVRFAYKTPGKPKAGDRQAAERSFAQGLQAHRSQRSNEAMQAYRTATQLDPSFYNAQYNLGLVAAEAGSLKTAMLAYENALAIQPDSLDARYNFALLLKQGDYYLDAANEFETILAKYPNDTRSHLALGNLYAQQLKEPAKAREHYTKVLQNDPRHAQAGAIHYWLAENPK